MSPLFGVYTLVDPSTYSSIYPTNPHPRIQEIASLITELFELFINMRYLPASSVAFPPHKHLPLDLTHPARYGVSKYVVDLWQMIPYRIENSEAEVNWNFGSDGGEFLQSGEFLDDLRGSGDKDDTWFRTIVDPCYGLYGLDDGLDSDTDDWGWDNEIGPYIRPWYATLSNVGNHGSVMVLNTKTWDMWLVDQLSEASTDPVFQERPGENQLEDHQYTNGFDLRQYPSRPAVDFLQDIIGRFRTLEWIPGGLYGPEPEDWDDRRYNNYRLLYEECGWPDNFNPLLFDKLRAEGGDKYDYNKQPPEAATEAQKAYEPLNQLYHVMAVERSLIVSQITLVDARYKLARGAGQLPDRDRRRLEAMVEMAQEDIEPPAQKWSDDQASHRIELDFRTSDLEALRTRTGRYSGPGWAGVSQEELINLYEDNKVAEEKRIVELRSLIEDKDMQMRLQRQYMEAKLAAAAVPEDAWRALAEEHKEWENDAWEGRWSILGSSTILVDVKRVLDEDMDLESLRKEIVYALEKREDPSWTGQRKWRNAGGVVAMAEVDDMERNQAAEL
ncbi:hypothetical protein VSDG_08285 [Cytospora chrysosperma]|uniref:Uncharacterized protein n=1 Tax=Cytospora chrysosperma TaxID=252740 RepID=A0A423VI95_CYTCH|nr:hypothetical protein VSDG_08285 [Valsa sordida]